MKLVRLALALLFLASTTIGVTAGAHAGCEQQVGVAAGADHAAQGHAHDAASQQHDHAPVSDKGDLDDKRSAAGATCHGGVGCPGCTAATGPALPSPASMPITFRPTAENGQSAEPDSQLRPPKVS